MQLPVPADRSDDARRALADLASRGFSHLVLSFRAPYRADLARWSAEELILPVLDGLAS